MWNKNNVKVINTAEKNINNIVFYSFYFISFVFILLIFVSLSSVSDQSGWEATVENVVKLWWGSLRKNWSEEFHIKHGKFIKHGNAGLQLPTLWYIFSILDFNNKINDRTRKRRWQIHNLSGKDISYPELKCLPDHVRPTK